MFTSTAAILDCDLGLLSLSKIERDHEISHRKIKHAYKPTLLLFISVGDFFSFQKLNLTCWDKHEDADQQWNGAKRSICSRSHFVFSFQANTERWVLQVMKSCDLRHFKSRDSGTTQ